MADLPENVTLEWIGRTLLAVQERLVSLDDQMLVQTNILLRLDDRDRSADNHVLRLMANIQRLEARVRVLEEERQ